MRSFSTKNTFMMTLLTSLLVVCGIDVVKGQESPDCKPQSRTYANFQGKYEGGVNVDLGILGSIFVGGTVTNDANAINGDPKSFSTLEVGVAAAGLLTSTQFLEFTTAGTNATARLLPAGKKVTIKFSLPKSALGLLSGLEIGTFTGLTAIGGSLVNKAGYTATNFYPAYSNAVLVNLINGAGDMEITLTPAQAYNGIYLKLTGNGLAVALSADLYHAYINEDAPIGNTCNTSLDVLAGARAGTAVGGIASSLAPVINKWNAVDGVMTTFAELDVTAQVLNETYHTTIFKNPGPAGDAVQIILQNPGGGLLNLSLLNGFTVQMYNGATQVGTALSSSSGLLSLSLLTVATVQYTVVTIPVPKAQGTFDRVEIKMGGLATVNLTQKLKIYEVKRIILPSPVINNINATSLTVCPGIVTLDVKENQDCTTYNWYSTSTSTTSLNNGQMPYNTSSLPVGTYTYYLEATRTNCTESSGRIPVTINVVSPPTPSSAGSNQNLCATTSSTTLDGNTPTIGSGTWIIVNKPVGNTLLNITSPTNPKTTLTGLTPTGTYVLKWTIDNGICKSESNVEIIVTPNATDVNMNAADHATCVGQSVTLTASSTTVSAPIFNWYSDKLLTNLIQANNTSLTISNPTTTKFYYVTVKGTGFCENAPNTAKEVKVTVNSKPGPPQLHLTIN